MPQTLRTPLVLLAIVCAGLASGGCAPAPAAGPSTSPAGGAPAASSATPASATAAAPTPAQRPAAVDRVKLSTAGRSMTTMPIQIANLKGFFLAEGVEVEMVYADNTVGVAAVANGDVEFMTQADTAVLGQLQGLPLKAIAWTAIRPPYVIVSQPTIQSPAELVGKTMGVSQVGTTPYIAITNALRVLGVDPSQINFRNAGNDQARLTSLASGQVDAAFFAPPVHVKAAAIGGRVLFITSDYVEHLVSGLATRENVIREQPEMVKKVLRGVLKSIAFIKANREETIDLEVAFQDLDHDSVAAAYDILVKIYPDNGQASEEAMQRQTDIQREIANVAEPVPWTRGTDLTLLREVQAELGLR